MPVGVRLRQLHTLVLPSGFEGLPFLLLLEPPRACGAAGSSCQAGFERSDGGPWARGVGQGAFGSVAE